MVILLSFTGSFRLRKVITLLSKDKLIETGLRVKSMEKLEYSQQTMLRYLTIHENICISLVMNNDRRELVMKREMIS